MRVKHLRVRNFTSLLDIELSDLPKLVVFIGQNSSGKSNLIDTLALMFNSFGSKLSQDLGHVDHYHHFFPNHSTTGNQPPEISIVLTLTGDEWARLLGIDHESGRRIEGEELWVTKRLVYDGGSVKWNTQTIDIGGWEVVTNGTFEYHEQLIALEGSLGDGSPVQIEVETTVSELLTKLNALLAATFEVVYTTESTRNWGNRFLPRPTIVDDAHISNLWQQSQSMGNRN